LGGAPGEQAPAGADVNVSGLAEGMGVAPSVIQAAIPLVLGALLKGNMRGPAASVPLDAEAVRATGVPQELALKTGIDLPQALLVVQQILEALRKPAKPAGASGSHKPAHAAKPARKKKPGSQSGASHAAGSTRPKSEAGASHASHSQGSSAPKPRPKTKPKSKS
jgi:hypothetical protein